MRAVRVVGRRSRPEASSPRRSDRPKKAIPEAARGQLTAAGLLSLQSTAGNKAVTSLIGKAPHRNPWSTAGRAVIIQRTPGAGGSKASERYPWIGRIRGAPSVALRSHPSKNPANPHGNTLADLPDGAWVDVLGRQGGWLKVRTTVAAREVEGYVSQELILLDRYDIDPPSLREALVVLKRAETPSPRGSTWSIWRRPTRARPSRRRWAMSTSVTCWLASMPN